MTDAENQAVFPDIVPDSVIGMRVWVHENDDFTEEETVADLLARLYDYPEDKFYLYVLRGQQISGSLRAALDNGLIEIAESKGHYYPHPKFQRHYVFIKEGFTQWDWEHDALQNGRMHFQHSLKLSEKARRTFEMQQLVAMHQAADSGPLILQPNFVGIGIDLKKAFSWLLQKVKARSF
jgi:hypothetical protein